MMPAFAVGMASYIVILEGIHLVTGRSVYLRISMDDPHLLGGVRRGVVTGVIMPFQIGTNWSRFAGAAAMWWARCSPKALTTFFLTLSIGDYHE